MKGIKVSLTKFLLPIIAITLAILFVLATAPVLSSEYVCGASGIFADGYETEIAKTYDGSPVAVDIKGSLSDGVTYVWYKRGDADAVAAESSALTVTYPSESGVYYCKATKEGVEETSSDITITVQKATAEVKINDVTTVYGEKEQALTYERTTPLIGSDADDDLKITLSRETGKNVGEYDITGISSSDKYDVRFIGGVYKITKRRIYVTVASLDSVYDEPLKELRCEAEQGSVFATGESIDDLNVTLKKESGFDAGRYAIAATYDNDNYDVIFTAATYTITPKILNFRVIGAENLVYSGSAPEITCEIVGDEAEASQKIIVSYDKAVKNAGDYVGYARIADGNYSLNNDGEFTFSIAKAPLKIVLSDIFYAKPEDITLGDYVKYYGFVGGENEKNLNVNLSANLPAVPGEYSIEPFGAALDNYEITYVEGKITVYKSELSAESGSLNGSFLPNATLTVTENATTDVNGYGRIDRLIVLAYKIDAEGGIAGKYTGKITLAKTPFTFGLRACIVDSDGVKHKLDGFSVSDGTITFTADSEGVLVLYYDLLLPAIIVLILLLIIIIVAIKRSSDSKKYKKATALAYAAKSYADEARYNLPRE